MIKIFTPSKTRLSSTPSHFRLVKPPVTAVRPEFSTIKGKYDSNFVTLLSNLLNNMLICFNIESVTSICESITSCSMNNLGWFFYF